MIIDFIKNDMDKKYESNNKNLNFYLKEKYGASFIIVKDTIKNLKEKVNSRSKYGKYDFYS